MRNGDCGGITVCARKTSAFSGNSSGILLNIACSVNPRVVAFNEAGNNLTQTRKLVIERLTGALCSPNVTVARQCWNPTTTGWLTLNPDALVGILDTDSFKQPRSDLCHGILSCIWRFLVDEISDNRNAQRVLVRAVGMTTFIEASQRSFAAFVYGAIAINEEVVAHITPIIHVSVKIPNTLHHRRGACLGVVVSRGSVVDNNTLRLNRFKSPT